MKSPVWILNSTLAVIVLGVLMYIVFSINYITRRPPLTPLKGPLRTQAVKQNELKPKDSSIIYENDLFGTFRPTVVQEEPVERLPVLPQPPAPKPLIPQQAPPIQFLPPLPLTITGIDYSSNELNSRVSIVNNNTNKSTLYKMGDKIFDASILRIFENKVALIRSNGQQEMLFRKASDAEAEIKELKDPTWSQVVQKRTDTSYYIDPQAFVERVQNLAYFIDMLDVTTATKKNISIGCRIGKMAPTSLGFALGFMPGDIITKINNKAPTTTTLRKEIYNNLASLQLGAKIKVELLRYERMVTVDYILQSLSQPTIMPTQEQPAPVQKVQEPEQPKTEQLAYDKSRLTPVITTYKQQDKMAMAQFGSKNSLLKQIPH
ncbi:hypothetical protein H0X48_06235 [Candidatus Dependentiae bacterium]|nr:hypothetical protein [Candidatus Dependentiae bacterium]